jgi:beta-glucosidase
LQVSPARIPLNGSATIHVTVKNTGEVAGTEVVQLYIRDVVSSVTTPQLSLRGFARVDLKPGESRTVDLKIFADDLALWNREMKRVVEPGEFKIMVGGSSSDIRLTESLWAGSN